MFGQTRFPTVGKSPYFLTLSPHAFYWFELEPDTAESASTPVNEYDLAELVEPSGSRPRRGANRRSFATMLGAS